MSVPEIDIAGFVEAHQRTHALLDVREPDEYRAGHVPGAVLVPLGQLGDRLDDVPTGGELFVICRSGARSASALELLAHYGIEGTNVAGGTLGWIAAGEPIVTGNQPS